MRDDEGTNLSADDRMRAMVAPYLIASMPKFDTVAFNKPAILKKARVAIVTTAGLMHPGDKAWGHDDADFRVFDKDDRDAISGHVSISLDRVGMFVDRNVFYPVDRLQEMADAGRIGSVAQRHISFMGALRTGNELSTVILDSGPRAAKQLRDDGVDVVILTPICPACARTVLVLGHILESHGLSTVALASNLEIAKHANAPRALYCDFPLGRPMGPPEDPEYQHRVLKAAFDLFDRPKGPVLEIFPDALKDEADSPIVCTLPPRYDPNVPAAIDEARGLRPAWDRAHAKYGGTNVGRRITPDKVPNAIAPFIKVAEGIPWKEAFSCEDEMIETAADIRHYYEEAATALVDHVPAARAAEAWFYHKTDTGRLLLEVFRVLRETGQEKELALIALNYIVPHAQADWFGDPPS